jgi:outer membrane protein TolC
MRTILRWWKALMGTALAGTLGAAMELEVLYPEEVFPALRPLLVAAAEQAPELRARLITVEEREGQAMVREAERHSRLFLHGRVMGGYESRLNFFDDNPSDGDESGFSVSGRPVATVDASLWWSKPIFAWGNLERYALLGELGVDAARLDYAEAVRVHLNEVRATYLRWQMAEQQLRLFGESVGLASQIVEAQRRLFAAGRVSEQSLLELEARLLEAEESRALFERERQYFRDRLGVLVGDEVAMTAVAVEEIPAFVLPEEAPTEAWRAALRAAGADAPGLERERRFAEIDAQWAETVRHNQRPTVDLVAGVVTNRLDTADIDRNTMRLVGYVGLQVRWNIFDGRRSEGERLAALARKRSREARLEAAEARLIDEGARLAADLRYQRAQTEAREQRARLLARRLELAVNPNAEDRISALALLDLRLELLRAEQRIVEAKANYLMTMTQLAALVFRDPVAGL